MSIGATAGQSGNRERYWAGSVLPGGPVRLLGYSANWSPDCKLASVSPARRLALLPRVLILLGATALLGGLEKSSKHIARADACNVWLPSARRHLCNLRWCRLAQGMVSSQSRYVPTFHPDSWARQALGWNLHNVG
jgi:hypothetical protein